MGAIALDRQFYPSPLEGLYERSLPWGHCPGDLGAES
jgi:hypothetical protein